MRNKCKLVANCSLQNEIEPRSFLPEVAQHLITPRWLDQFRVCLECLYYYSSLDNTEILKAFLVLQGRFFKTRTCSLTVLSPTETRN